MSRSRATLGAPRASPDPRAAEGPALFRSGDSAILVVRTRDLPLAPAERDRELLRTWRSEAGRARLQESVPGKILLLDPPLAAAPAGAVPVRFGQILPGETGIEWNGRCGNALAAAAVYLAGVQAEPLTADGAFEVTFVEGPRRLRTRSAVQPSNAGDAGRFRVQLKFFRPICAMTGSLFPAAGAWHRLELAGGSCDAFLIDAGNPYALIAGGPLGVPDVLHVEDTEALHARLREVRRQALALFGLPESRVFPKIALIAGLPDPAVPTLASAMLTLPGLWHPSYALTGLLTLAVAAGIEGSPVRALLPWSGWPSRLRVVSPSRTFDLRIGPRLRPRLETTGCDIPSWVAVDQQVRREVERC